MGKRVLGIRTPRGGGENGGAVYRTDERVIKQIGQGDIAFDLSLLFRGAMTEATAIQQRREREGDVPLVGDYVMQEESVQTIAAVWDESIQLAAPTSFLGLTEDGTGVHKGGMQLPISRDGLVEVEKKINRFRMLPLKDYTKPHFVEIPVVVWAQADEV
ncbi:hypothetical protein [Salinibacter ruber]|jgi:hypothetical protein|uniref:Uncharacterized protein n=2 Tax=Salinibacter ruber TaxID=146919 RepID=A0A9X2QB54_9BACT|nr:hypothetical protein [Salinibacter ruber]MCS3660092.1 hypothetical protein [Salinibacter ruber]MCS3709777.1 hypothetical protein [Salinibacter ruber]